MSDDDYPNIGGAWTSTSAASSASAASWNPAFRPDSHRSHAINTSAASNDDFFDKHPAPTPEQPRARQHATLEEQDKPEAPSRSAPAFVNHAADQSEKAAAGPEESSDDVLAAQEDRSEFRQQSLAADEPDDEVAIFGQHESVKEQESQLENKLPLPPREPIFIGTPGTDTQMRLEQHEDESDSVVLDSRQSTGHTYEHQGEILDMEQAVDEAPSAPLLEDPEEPPVVEELKREPTLHAVVEDSVLGFDRTPAYEQSLSKPKAQPGNIDRSFTTNFTELQTSPDDRDQNEEAGVPVSAGWPSAGDDKTFGELLGDDDLVFTATSKEAASDVLHNDPVDDGWGGADDNTFGELLGNESTLVDEGAQDVAAAESSGNGEQDLAAIWQAALDDDDLLDESNDLDPSAFFGDDDSGFLEDELAAPAPVPVQQPISQPQRTANSYVPVAAQQPAQQHAAPLQYAAPTSANLSQSHGRSVGTPSTGLYDVYGHGATTQPQPAQRPSAQSAQSFADKAKGGYQSPYDLPMEVVKQPRQRPRQAQSGPQAMPTLPPRSSSMSSQTGPPHPRPPTTASGASMSPPPSAGSVSAAPPPTSTNGVVPPKSTPKGDSGFFADLPIAAKPRSRVSGVYTPQVQPVPTPPPDSASPQPPVQAPAGAVQPPPRPTAPRASIQQQTSTFGGLSQPERLPLLPDQPTTAPPAQPHAPVAASQSQRYSPGSLPAPTQSPNRFSPAPPSGTPPSTSRYSPAPAAQVGGAKKYSISGPAVAPAQPGIHNSHAFAPRTSSPLAFSTEKAQSLPANDSSRQLPQIPVSPPKPNGGRSASSMSPDRATSLGYFPNDLRTSGVTGPSQRAVTGSPPAAMKPHKYSMQAVPESMSTTAPVAASGQRPNFLAHRRQFSRDLSFTPPNDEHANDPLQRWKGHPVFRWGDSGSVVSSFPKQTPFYAAGHGIPSVKCTSGAISIQQASTFMPMEDRNAKFPGPLTARAKGRRKEVLTWMTGKIEDLERRNELVRMDFEMEVDLRKRAEEKLVLWKLVKIFVEHDGKLEGDKKIEDEVRTVLLPNLAQMGQGLELQSSMSATPGLQSDGIDRTVIIQLRQALLEGNRERAVWLAEEKKLWGHAMLIASTMGPDTWKQIIQSFVRSQVKTVGSDARSLAALYQVFAGNSEECVDELVPPSARAGFQMISKSDGTVSGNPLEGLDQWRETLGLVAGNRTPSDQQSLLALGRLLSGYGRAEAAHSCFLFARQLIKHSGADDAEASFVILGANHQSQNESFANDLDAIILTEIYEWACSLSAPSNAVHYVPHLQSFKLIHAQELAAFGLKSKAQSYCDHITSAYTSTTRPSPYYHPTFTQAVNNLSAFLSQTPQTGSAGLLSKGAMNKVSSGAASWFTKFVSGDDERESAGSGPGAGEDGPFGRVSGDSPMISRSGSQADLYNPMMGGGVPFTSAGTLGSPPQAFAPSSAPGRYAPISGSNKYAPTAAGGLSVSPHHPISPVRPASARSYAPVAAAAQPLAAPRADSNRAVSDHSIPYGSDSRHGSAQYPGSPSSYEPKPLLSDESPAYGYQPQRFDEPSSTFDDTSNVSRSINGLGLQHEETVPNAEDGGYQAPSTGYEPPIGGYEPPSYQPYQPEADNDSAAPPAKKKSFMDDDDDGLSKQAAAMKKAEADRQADEAFKKAAEADAARDKSKGADKKGWFGGWFGKKDADSLQPGPIKAKLGEENSFYYDEKLKKWVNKKGGSEAATPAAATPPPPRGPASRAVSGAMGPPSGPPSRVASAAGMVGPPGARIPSTGSTTGSPSLGPPSGPPSRAGTPATGDGSPMPAAVAALNGSDARPLSAPPGRPATGMSSASSLDDLLGGPPGPGQRKAGGTVKGKKKGARYVDVMQSG